MEGIKKHTVILRLKSNPLYSTLEVLLNTDVYICMYIGIYTTYGIAVNDKLRNYVCVYVCVCVKDGK